MQKNKIIKIIFGLVLFFGTVVIAHAQLKDYTVLTPLPGTLKTGVGYQTDFATYLPGMFSLIIYIAGFMAFVMITFGGVMYMTTDAISAKAKGREYINNAVIGLLLVIGAWVILYTINPKILRFDLELAVPPSTPGGTVPGVPMTEEQIADDLLVRNELWNSSETKPITANGNPCTEGQTTGCTNLNGLPRNAIDGLIRLNQLCGPLCTLTVTGGTEGGHVTHGVGNPMVDLRRDQAISNWIISHATGEPVNTRAGKLYTVNVGGQTVRFLDEIGGAPHWHTQF